MSGEPGDIGDITSYQNGTGDDSDVSDYSHLDAPSETVYIVCGVLIAMVLVAAIIVLLALFISKLRKRDENNRHHRHSQDHVIQTTQNNVNNNHLNHINNNGTATMPSPVAANGGTTICTVSANVNYPPPLLQPPTLATDGCPAANQQRQFIWQIPAAHPFALYSNDKETLVHTLPSEQPGFCRGFRKNLQGRWKRLVKRKPINDAYAIPPELRDQLKNIYVY